MRVSVVCVTFSCFRCEPLLPGLELHNGRRYADTAMCTLCRRSLRERSAWHKRQAGREHGSRERRSESRDVSLNEVHVHKVAAGVAARPQLCQQLAANPIPRETSDGLRLPWSSPATSTVLTK